MVRVLLAAVVAAAVLIAIIASSQHSRRPDRVSGYIEADTIRLGSQVGGRVARVLVEEGQAVRRDQVLIELEPFDLLELQREAAANLAAREAEHQRLRTGYRPEEVRQAQARVDQLTAHLEQLQNGPREQEIEAARARQQAAVSGASVAQQNYERMVSLVGKNAASQEDLDRATDQLHAAQSLLVVREQELELLLAGTRREELAQAQAQLEEARQTLQLVSSGYRAEEVEAAKAAVDAAAAALAALQARLAELKIRAPVDGVIQALDLHPGDLVAARAPVLSLLDAQRMWVRAYVPQDRMNLRLGQSLRVTVDSYPDQVFRGQVVFISDQAEFTPSNVQTYDERIKQVFRIKVELLEPAGRLRPGMAADVHLEPDQL